MASIESSASENASPVFRVTWPATANARCSRPIEPDKFDAANEIDSADEAFRMGRDVMLAMIVHRFQIGSILDEVRDRGLFGPYASFDELCLTEYGLNSTEADALINNFRTVAGSGVQWRDVKKLSGWQQRMFRETAASGALRPDDFGKFMKIAGRTNSAKPVSKRNSR